MHKFVKQYFEDFKPYKGFWCYEDGILLKACLDLYKATKDEYYKDFLIKYLDEFIDEDGNPKDYKIEDYSTDDVQSGTVLFDMIKINNDPRYSKAIELFVKQLKEHPRCKCGNYFHKKKYQYQVWMDGLYMALPFYAKYAIENDNKEIIDDIMNQFANVRKYLFDEERKLYVHAYDENKVMQWADKETGKAPNVWSRACGWMAMALIDLYEIINEKYPEYSATLFNLLKEEIDGIIPHLDNKTKMVKQVIDAVDEKNYLETSGTAMIAYSMVKGYNLGLFDKNYLKPAKKMLKGMNKTYLRKENGKYGLGGICQVAGLDNERRNGSKEYYYSEKICVNEVKGVAPYFMLLAELEKVGL